MEKRGFWDNLFAVKGKDLLRVGSFFTILFVFLLVLLLIGVHFVNKILGGIDEIEPTKGGFKIVTHGRTDTIIDVPASVFGVSSDIPLDTDKKIEINASGAVITDFDPLSSEVLGWRDPDGDRVNFYKKEQDRGKQGEESDKLKLMRLMEGQDADYGCLLGIVFEDESNPLDKLRQIADLVQNKKAAIFKIGKQATIEFKDHHFIIDHKNNFRRDKLEEKYAGSHIFFIANDCILTKPECIKNVLCAPFKNNSGPDHKMCLEGQLKDQRLVKKMKLDLERYNLLQNPRALWYTDNMGHFTVLVKTKSAGLFP